MSQKFSGTIFFYCFPPSSAEKAAYQHSIICLAEGLKELGIPFFSDRNYWRLSHESEEYLFQNDPNVTPDDCSIVILNDLWFRYGGTMPKNLFNPKRKYLTVFFELWGKSYFSLDPEFRQFDFVFKAHCSKVFKYPSNIHPWAFGLSNRIIREAESLPNYQNRNKKILVNFRFDHSVREIVSKNFLPLLQDLLAIDNSRDQFDATPDDSSYDKLQWTQTGRRHYPSYYKRLRESAACACFGGVLKPSWIHNPLAPNQFWYKALSRLDPHPTQITRWESWRFWEALATGCTAFHVDYDNYGAQLPVMPENWKHYVGIDLDNMQAAIDRLVDEPEVLKDVSREGRAWALEHYSPMPTAERFLKTISGASNSLLPKLSEPKG